MNILVGGDINDAIRKADVVQIHGLWEQHCVTTGVLARRHRKPVVVSAHGMLESWAVRNKAWKKWPYSILIERPNLRRAAVLRALTPAEAHDYRRFGLNNPIAVIPNGVDLTQGPGPDLARSSWPEVRDRRLVLYMSRIHYKKGVDLLVEAWSRLTARFPDAHLVIAGPDFEGTRANVERQPCDAHGSGIWRHEVFTSERRISVRAAVSLRGVQRGRSRVPRRWRAGAHY
jgi:glycosyltransferase involved in cell wall biosynthesis